MGGSEHPISVLSGRQPATSIYADGRSPGDVIACCRDYNTALYVADLSDYTTPFKADNVRHYGSAHDCVAPSLPVLVTI